MKKIRKKTLFLIIPLLSTSVAVFLFYNSMSILYFFGYYALLTNRTLIKYSLNSNIGYSERAESMASNIYIIFYLYIFCLINLYFYKKIRKALES